MLYNQSKIDLIVQARFGSTRLPGKVMKELEDKLVLDHVVERLRKSNYVRNVIICTSDLPQDDIIVNHCKEKKYLFFRGSELNVLERYYHTAKHFQSEYVVRVTSDCPLVDHWYIDKMIEKYLDLKLDYLGPEYYGNHKFPDGFNGEIFSFKKLEEAYLNASETEKEHVSTYIIKKYKTIEFDYPIDLNNYPNINFEELHLSLDTAEDYELLKNIFHHVYLKNKEFTLEDVLNYLNHKN